MRALLFGACFVALSACALEPQQAGSSIKDWSTVIIRLERGPCMGGCPIYKVEIHGDGTVAYEGINFVPVTGKQTAKISPDEVKALVAKFEAARFGKLKPEYRGDITDGVTYRTTLEHDGQSKMVTNYMGYLAKMPPSVRELEDAIDALAGTKKWVSK